MSGYLSKKCDYGENIAALTHTEKIFYFVNTFQTEINSGGLEQYLRNSSGAYMKEVIPSLSAIGANRTSEIFKEVIESIPTLPVDEEQRNILLDKLLSEDVSQKFSFFDQQFYKHPNNIDESLHHFAVVHRNDFI